MQLPGCVTAPPAGGTDEVLRALADPARRRLLESLRARDGQCQAELCEQLDMARQSATKHLAVLERAGLLRTTRRGRQKLHYLDARPILALAEGWIDRFGGPGPGASGGPAEAGGPAGQGGPGETAEPRGGAGTHPARQAGFACTTLVHTTPKRIWQAFTDPAQCRRALGFALEADWRVGATYVWEEHGVRVGHPDQVVLEYEPHRRLAFAFHTFTPAYGAAVGLPAETLAVAAAEPRSRVAFAVEPCGDLARWTVVHDGFEPGSAVLGVVARSWPARIARLRQVLETPASPPAPAPAPAGAHVHRADPAGRYAPPGRRRST